MEECFEVHRRIVYLQALYHFMQRDVGFGISEALGINSLRTLWADCYWESGQWSEAGMIKELL